MTSATAIRFFKIILKESVEDGNLKIPNKFTRKYVGGLSNPMFLKPPDGTEWKVYWTKHDHEIWFEKGWKEFAKYYSLDHGHLVLFEYKGTSDFEVHLFDMSTLEIDYPKHGTHNEEDNNSVEILDELPLCKKTKLKSPMSSPQPRKKVRSGTTGDVSSLQNMLQHVQNRGSHSQETNFEMPIMASVKQELDEDIGEVNFTAGCPKAKQLASTKITNKSLNTVTTFRSKNPSFKLVMKPSYINRYSLHIPLQFAEKYLKNKQGDVLLQVSDARTWSAVYSFPKINAGWNRFASDNNLKVGDACVFELTKCRGLSFKVSIFRALFEEPNCPLSQAQGNGVDCLGPERIIDVDSKTCFSSKGQKAAKRNSLLIKPFTGTTGARKEAEKFTSENPFFKVNIRLSSQVKTRPHVPIVFVRKYLKNKKQNVMIKFGKKLWPIKLLYYPFKAKASSKFSSGWSSFAKETKLQHGDVCIFELINKEDAVFDVHIFRGHS